MIEANAYRLLDSVSPDIRRQIERDVVEAVIVPIVGFGVLAIPDFVRHLTDMRFSSLYALGLNLIREHIHRQLLMR
jgi:hypothetical protein